MGSNPCPSAAPSFRLAFFQGEMQFSSTLSTTLRTHRHLRKTLGSPLMCGNLKVQTIHSQDRPHVLCSEHFTRQPLR